MNKRRRLKMEALKRKEPDKGTYYCFGHYSENGKKRMRKNPKRFWMMNEYHNRLNDYKEGHYAYEHLKELADKYGYHLPKIIRTQGYKEMQLKKLKSR